VDESAHYVATIDAQRRASDDRVAAGHRHVEVETSVRPVFVVVPDVLVENPVQVTTTEDEDPV